MSHKHRSDDTQSSDELGKHADTDTEQEQNAVQEKKAYPHQYQPAAPSLALISFTGSYAPSVPPACSTCGTRVARHSAAEAGGLLSAPWPCSLWPDS